MNLIQIILLSICAIFITVAIFGLKTAQLKKRKREMAEAADEGKKEGKIDKAASTASFSFKWTARLQAVIVVLLLIASITILFWSEIKVLFGESTLIAFGIIAVAAILLIGGDPQKTIQRVRKIAIILLALLLAVFIFWPAAKTKYPELAKITTSSQIPSERKAFTQKSAANDFPATDDSGQPVILEPGERIVVTKNEDEPAATLIFRSGSSERFLPTDRWSAKGTVYTHTGQYANEPVKVFYTGAGRHYRFKKTNGAAQTLAAPITKNRQTQCLLDEKFGKKTEQRQLAEDFQAGRFENN